VRRRVLTALAALPPDFALPPDRVAALAGTAAALAAAESVHRVLRVHAAERHLIEIEQFDQKLKRKELSEYHINSLADLPLQPGLFLRRDDIFVAKGQVYVVFFVFAYQSFLGAINGPITPELVREDGGFPHLTGNLAIDIVCGGVLAARAEWIS